MKIFDPATIAAMGIPQGTRLVSIDLDLVVLNQIDGLFNRPERFVGWHVPGHRIKGPVLNGSLFMWNAGDLGWLWSEFDPATSPKAACSKGYLGSDQAYLSHRLIGQDFVGKWTPERDGVLSFYRDIRGRKFLAASARIVFFAGRVKPWHQDVKFQAPWIARYVDYNQKVVSSTGSSQAAAGAPARVAARAV